MDDFAAAFVRLEGDIVLDFRISWAMHIDTPGDTIILGTEGALRIPSTDCWNGSVGGPMTLYHDVAGQQTETVIPIIPNSQGWGGLFYQKIRSFLDAIKNGGNAPVPSSRSCTIRPLLTASSSPRKKAGKLRFRFPPSIERTASVLLWTHPGFSIAASSL